MKMTNNIEGNISTFAASPPRDFKIGAPLVDSFVANERDILPTGIGDINLVEPSNVKPLPYYRVEFDARIDGTGFAIQAVARRHAVRGFIGKLFGCTPKAIVRVTGIPETPKD